MKLEKIKKRIRKFNNKSDLRRRKRFNDYLNKKIAKFYGLAKHPKYYIIIEPNNIIHKSVNLRKSDFKICGRNIFRLPTNTNDMFIKFLSLLKNKMEIPLIMHEIEMTKMYNREAFRNKYVYLIFIPSARL